jgi:hypothetical protein
METYEHAIYDMKFRPQFWQYIAYIVHIYLSVYKCVQPEDGLMWAKTCSCDWIYWYFHTYNSLGWPH